LVEVVVLDQSKSAVEGVVLVVVQSELPWLSAEPLMLDQPALPLEESELLQFMLSLDEDQLSEEAVLA
jgi:hypothetical protein